MNLKFIADEHKMSHDNTVWDLRKRVHDSKMDPLDWVQQMDYLDVILDACDCEITIEECVQLGN